MPHLNWIEPDAATGEAAEFYQMAGVAPIMRCLSLRPDFAKLIAQAADLLHFSNGFLSRRDHEAIASYVSAVNRCPF